MNTDQNGQVSEEDSPCCSASSNDLSGENSSRFERSDNADLEEGCPGTSGAAEGDNVIPATDGKEIYKFHVPEVLLLTLVRPSGSNVYKEIKENKLIYVASGNYIFHLKLL